MLGGTFRDPLWVVPSPPAPAPLSRGAMQTPSPAPDATAPSAEALDAVLNQLEAAGDAVGVVRLVDRWAHEGAPSRAARMAEARALIRLCLMDRAWARLRELAVEDPDDVDVVRLTAEMFFERGWQGRAGS